MSKENVTLRPKRTRKTLSFSEADDSILTNPSSNYSLANSLPDLTSTYKEDVIKDMEEQIRSLKCQLESAHNQIDELLLENTLLQKNTQDQIKKINYLKTICTTTPLTNKNKLNSTTKRNTNKSCSKTLDFKKTETPQDMPSSRDNKPKYKNNQNNSKDNLRGPTTDVLHQIISTQQENNNEPQEKAKTTKPRIIILGDENIRGLSRQMIDSRINTWNDHYTVSAMCKPGAASDQILTSLSTLIPTLTNKDIVILSVGSNEKNPFKFFSKICNTIKTLETCKQVFILKVQRNPFLNENLLNNHIKLLIRNFKNCKLIDTFETYDCNNMYLKRIPKYTETLCFKLNIEIDYLQYHNQFITKNRQIVKHREGCTKYKQTTIVQYFKPSKINKHNTNTSTPQNQLNTPKTPAPNSKRISITSTPHSLKNVTKVNNQIIDHKKNTFFR